MSWHATSAVGSSYFDVFVFFVAVAIIGVLLVFNSPAVDYRFVAGGAVLPLLEGFTGRPLILHTLVGSVVLLSLVMALTVRSRLLRRRLLGVPIGTFVFLLFSGAWTRSELFWWPVFGFDGIAVAPLPEFDRPLPLLLLLELLGFVGLVWVIRRFRLTEAQNLQALLRSGRLPKEHFR